VGDLGPGSRCHHLGGLLLECGFHLRVGSAVIADDIETGVHGQLTRGGRGEYAHAVIASGEQLARGEKRRQISSASPTHDQNVIARRVLVVDRDDDGMM
jgi:hypothetical protein